MTWASYELNSLLIALMKKSRFCYIVSIIFIYLVNFTEPMLTMGSINPVMWKDNWTVVTEDGSLSAQFEHTLLITPDGAEIMTQC
jgi:methionine aminopeptidase